MVLFCSAHTPKKPHASADFHSQGQGPASADGNDTGTGDMLEQAPMPTATSADMPELLEVPDVPMSIGSDDDEPPWVADDIGEQKHSSRRPPWRVASPAATPKRTIEHFARERHLEPRFLGWMLKLGMPMVMLNMMFSIAMQFPNLAQDLDMVEFYSGKGVVANAFRSSSFKAAKFDINRDRLFEDACTPEGFMTQLALAMRLKVGQSLAHWGTMCSSWVFMSRSATGRSELRVMGDQQCRIVREGNVQVARMGLILLYFCCTLKGWIVEQPGTSLMKRTPWVRWLLRNMREPIFSHTWLGMFGGETMKPTELLSPCRWPKLLRRQRDTTLDERWAAADGVKHETHMQQGESE